MEMIIISKRQYIIERRKKYNFYHIKWKNKERKHLRKRKTSQSKHHIVTILASPPRVLPQRSFPIVELKLPCLAYELHKEKKMHFFPHIFHSQLNHPELFSLSHCKPPRSPPPTCTLNFLLHFKLQEHDTCL